jgi:hypothetical protein
MRLWTCWVVCFVVLLTGCTKDKALALKAAAEAYRDSAVTAIQDYEILMVNGLHGPQRPEAELYQEVLNQLKATGIPAGKVSPDQVKTAIQSMDARERDLADLQARLADLRGAYVAYAGSLARLPEGSFLAGEAVTCSAALGVRLTQRLMHFADVASKNPVRYQYRFNKALAELNAALSKKDDQAIERAVNELVETRKAERRDNAAAAAKFIAAVDAGVRTVGLANAYSNLSLTDMLVGLNQILEIQGLIVGAEQTQALERLASARARLEQDPLIKPILEIPLNAPIPACKAN